jgi:hypothetical protein
MPTATRRSRVSTKDPIHITVAPSGAGKSATGTSVPAAASQAKPAAPAKPATPAKPKAERVVKPPEGIPFLPAKGGKVAVKDASGIVATRELVGTIKAPAVRLFTGNTGKITNLKIGAKFATHHGKNLANCGIWTIIAVVAPGEVTGKLPADVTALAVNEIK